MDTKTDPTQFWLDECAKAKSEGRIEALQQVAAFIKGAKEVSESKEKFEAYDMIINYTTKMIQEEC